MRRGTTVEVPVGIKRKNALRRLEGITPRIEGHLGKIAHDPDSRDVNHWKSEIRGWLAQLEEVLPSVGKQTATKWMTRIAAWEGELGE